MDQAVKDFVQETLDFVAIAKRCGKRIAFWGWNAEVVGALERSGMLDGLETIFISNEFPVQDISACKFTQHYFDIDELYNPPEALASFNPDKVCILHTDPYRAITDYELVVRTYGVNPMNVYATSKMWQIHDYDDRFTYRKIIDSIPKGIPGGLIPWTLRGLYNGLRFVVQNGIPGRIVNYGISRGWSMYFIGQVLDSLGDTDRPIVGFDGFMGFPQRSSEMDLCNLKYNKVTSKITPQSSQSAQEQTEENLAPHMHRTTIIAGDIAETISQLGDEPVALALFDMDDYTPTKVALAPTYECLSPGGVFIMDHYTYNSIGGFCVGQRIAMLEFLEQHPMLGFPETHMFFKSGK